VAKLTVDDLSLEVAYKEYTGWVYYDIWFRWRGELMINDAILKRSHGSWAERSYGAIKACEHRECGFLPLLRGVLEKNEADYWEPLDPDIVVALYPDGGFPFLPPKWRTVWEKPEVKAAREAREKEREEKGPLPDDLIELMVFVDTYNFEDGSAYCGDGICLRLTPTRAELTEFYGALRNEYLVFREKYGIEAANRRDLGPDYEEPYF
jgi:hypothetical protein